MATHDVEIRIRAVDQATAKIRNIDRALKDLNRVSAGQARAQAAQSRVLGGVGMTGAGRGGRSSGGVGFMPLGMPPSLLGAGAAGLGIKGVVSAAMDFETALVGIQKKGELTEAQLARVKKEILDLSSSKELVTSPERMAAAYERMAAAGIPLEDMREMATLAAKAADAWDMAEEEVGNSFAGFSKTLKVPMAEMERFADVINSLADAGISDERDIVAFLDDAGPTLVKSFGMAREEAAALGATLVDLKLEPSRAARFAGDLVSKLMNPQQVNKTGIALFQKHVGSIGEFQEMIRKNPRKAMLHFFKQMEKLDKFEQGFFANKFLGAGWDDEFQILAAGIDTFKDHLNTVDSGNWVGSLGRGYDLKLNTMAARWDQFKSKIAKTAINVGDMGMPAVEGILGRLNAMFEDWERRGSPFEHMQAAMSGFAAGAGYASFSSMLDDMGSKLERLFNMESDPGSLTGTFGAWRESANSAASAFERLELTLLRAYQAKLVLNRIGKNLGIDFLADDESRAANEKALAEVEERIRVLTEYQDLRDRLAAGAETRRPSKRQAEESSMAAAGLAGLLPPPPDPSKLLPAATPSTGKIPLPTGRPETGIPTPTARPGDSKGDRPVPSWQVRIGPPPPQVDVTDFLTKLGEITSAKHSFEQPMVTAADISTAAFMTKLGQLESAAAATARRIRASLSNISVTAPGGDGGSYDTNRRSQFAPVTP